ASLPSASLTARRRAARSPWSVKAVDVCVRDDRALEVCARDFSGLSVCALDAGLPDDCDEDVPARASLGVTSATAAATSAVAPTSTAAATSVRPRLTRFRPVARRRRRPAPPSSRSEHLLGGRERAGARAPERLAERVQHQQDVARGRRLAHQADPPDAPLPRTEPGADLDAVL